MAVGLRLRLTLFALVLFSGAVRTLEILGLVKYPVLASRLHLKAVVRELNIHALVGAVRAMAKQMC